MPTESAASFDPTTARMNAGMSIRGLAAELDMPEQSIRRLEAGKGITLARAKRVADFFGVRVVDLPFAAEPTPQKGSR